MHNILLTGASGYLGGSILAQLHNPSSGIELPAHNKIYELVRSDAQAQAVREYGAEPASFDPGDEAAIEMSVERQTFFIRALARLRQQTGKEVHFLQTSGAKIFSDLAGAPTDKPLLDTDHKLYEIQTEQQTRAPFPAFQKAVSTNNTVISLAEELGVKSYIIAPCIVYGEGLGFGNKISAQTVAIVRAAKEAKRVYRVDNNSPTWPVCHIRDNTDLYIRLLAAILSGNDNIGHGRQGYYLPSPGSVAWDDLYARMAVALAKKGIIEDEQVKLADDEALEVMSRGLSCPKAYVRVQLAGKCTLTPKHGTEALGWAPKFAPEHILETAETEVELILKHI
ncbi:hypothetical protein T069G_02354 [Trichoderma breve]|uniref:NAD-dependent epimerase/dehydratase domain-containing protein n=1 Tax=Trichoderma breve TaxID=2034170 RepID=A0A9W9BDY7_9HYPO|nr:hypothetical protein T069G_02354 [Trichoderma breve]KAJ4861400.1 hypothetical protein T069G_02354 [Trichoderma breve]